MTLEQAARPTFAAHQTFHPRFGWLKKGFDAAQSDPTAFNHEDATVELGVGKNMVEAIRFWVLAMGVTARRRDLDRPRLSVCVPTCFGTSVLGSADGLDPYMEDPATLWILHWHALSAPSLLPVWWATFNDFNATEFSEGELTDFCIDEVAATTWSHPKASSVRKDVDCLLRMYSKRAARGRQTLDDLLDSPFRQLGLIQPVATGRDHFRFVRGDKVGLAPEAITYACLDFLAMTDPGARTVSVTRLTSDPGSPGRVFRLHEDAIASALEYTSAEASGLQIANPAGATQLVVDDEPSRVAKSVLAAHYGLQGRQLPRIGDVAGPAARWIASEFREQYPTSLEERDQAQDGDAA